MKLIPLLFLPLALFFNSYGPPFKATVLRHDHIARMGGHLESNPDTPTGESWVDAFEHTITPNTWTIPNCIGHGFALVVDFENVPKGVTTIDLRVDYPTMHLPDGTKQSSIERKEELIRDGDYATFGYSYYFDEPYETNTGDWNFTLSHQDKVIYKATFTVAECTLPENE
ncbi:MAG: DUF3859 domain-containing protein [Verrucomicrobiota bacterium]